MLEESRGKSMKKADFVNELKGELPPDIQFLANYLYGMTVSKEDSIVYVNEEELPINILDRFAALFSIYKYWSQQEIEPFFHYYETPTLSFTDLGQRYARFADDMWMPK